MASKVLFVDGERVVGCAVVFDSEPSFALLGRVFPEAQVISCTTPDGMFKVDVAETPALGWLN